MKWRRLLSCVVLLSGSIFVCAQNKRAIDSLNTLLQKERADTNKVFIMYNIGNYYQSDTANAWKYFNMGRALSEKINYPRGIGGSFVRKGRILEYLGSFDDARAMYDSALNIYAANQLKARYAVLCINMGNTYYTQGDYANAMLWNQKAMDGCEEVHDNVGEAQAIMNLGNISYARNRFDEAIASYKNAMKYAALTKDSLTIGSLLNNIGAVYFDQKKFEQARDYFNQASQIRFRSGDLEGMGSSLCNLAESQRESGLIDSALITYNRSIEIYKQVPDMVSVAANMVESALLIFEKGDRQKAIDVTLEGYDLAHKYGDKPTQKMACDQLAKFYSEQNDFKNAFTYLTISSQLQDTLLGEASTRQLAEMQTKFETVKKQKENDELKKNEVIKDKEIEEKDNQRRLLFGGIGFVLILVIIVLIAYVNKRRSNIMLELKNMQIEEQKKQITDSILYASRIQKAQLPTEKYISRKLKDLNDDAGSPPRKA